MGWLDEQIRLRKQNDDKVFEDRLREAAENVLGRRSMPVSDDRELAGSVLEKILRYYHMPYPEIPDDVNGLEEQMEYVLHPQGMMYRKVALKKGWHRDAVGAFLGFRREDGSPVALIPAGLVGYRCYDIAAGTSYRITSRTESRLAEDAFCFYRPFPRTRLSIPALIRYILSSLRVGDIVLIAAVSLVAVLVGFLIPRLTNILYGDVLENKATSVLAAIAVFMICASTAKLIITTARDLISNRVELRIRQNVESSAMMRVLSLPPDFFHDFSSGELSSRLQSVNTLCATLVNSFLSTGLTSLMSLLYITQIFEYAPVLLIPSLVIILLTVAVNILTMFLETSRQKKVLAQEAKTTGLAFALVSGIQKIRLAGAEKRTFARWAGQYNRSAKLLYDPPLLLKASGTISLGISLGGTIALYAVALSGAVTMKDYMSFNAAYGMVMGAFGSLASIATVAARIKPVLDLARPLLSALPETAGERRTVTELRGAVEMDNVTFRYTEGGPKIIDNMSLQISPGEYVAVVGPSGCGKTTLIRLLLGFERPETGSIFYDRKNIDQLDLPSLRRRIGTVLQDGGLFNNSIYANIAISAPGLTLDQAWEAAETACIADDIRAMPMGMHTIISEGQGGISGGQKQRLMIARAIAPKPAILIFDEATSALDNITQKKVIEALDHLRCTRLVIAHRLSTIKSCGRILYMENGKILEEGTYEELIDQNGRFADMVARQQV